MAFLPIINMTKVKEFTDEAKFGTVVANNDPKKLGRVKVEIPGLFEGNPEGMPWIRRKTDTAFSGSNVEIFDVPEIGSVVEVKWNYDESTPMYSGAPYNLKHQSNAFTDNYPHQGGIKFGKILLKFDKGSNSLTIENGEVQIVLDGMGGMSIACDTVDIISSNDIMIKAPTTIIQGDMQVTGSFSCANGANGIILPSKGASVSGGIVEGIV